VGLLIFKQSYLDTDKLPAISAPNSGFDDFIFGNEHVQVSDSKQSQADASKVEYVLDKHPVQSVRTSVPRLDFTDHG
jgi:hypothetical protein